MKNIIVYSLLFFAFCWTQPLLASNVKSGEKVNITEPVATNLYIAAGEIEVNALLDRDLMAAGGEIFINDTIRQDALLAGGKVTIDGVIGEDLRIIGGSVRINRDILGDLTVTGGEVEIADDVTIYGDLLIAGGEVRFKGVVKGLTTIAGGQVVFDGTAEGATEINAGMLRVNGELRAPSSLIAQNLEIGEAARFLADVQYYSESGEIDFSGRLYENAKATYQPNLKPDYESWSGWKDWKKVAASMFFFSLFASALLIALIVAAFHRFFLRASDGVMDKVLNDLGIGLLYVIGVPALILIAFITVIGIPAGLIASAFYGISISLGRVLVSILAAYVLADYGNKAWTKGQFMLVSIGIFLVLKVISWIPIVGFIASFLLVLVTFGAIIQAIRTKSELNEEAL